MRAIPSSNGIGNCLSRFSIPLRHLCNDCSVIPSIAAHLDTVNRKKVPTAPLTAEPIASLQDLTTEVAKGLEAAQNDLQTRRRIVDLLHVRAALALNDDEQASVPTVCQESVCYLPSTLLTEVA